MTDNKKPSNHLNELITNVIRAQVENRGLGQDEYFGKQLKETLLSPMGKKSGVTRSAMPEDALLMASLQMLVALESAGKFVAKCDVLFNSRSLDRATKADWCRSLAWHYGYVLRNRMTAFLKLMIKCLAPVGKDHPELVKLKKCFDEYKATTDDYYTERGRHTHTAQVDDPLLEQVQLLEALLKEEKLQAFQPIYKEQAQKVRAHVRSECCDLINKTSDATEACLAQIEKIITATFRVMESHARKSAA